MVVPATLILDAVATYLREVARRSGDLRLLVTGPRSTRWAGGDRFGWTIVSRLAMALDDAALELGRSGTD